MTFPYTTPILGIVSQQDSAEADMLAIVSGASNNRVWTYVKPRASDNRWIPLESPEAFTPLSHFFCMAVFTPHGKLTVTHYNALTRAKYANGTMRPWQGKASETISIRPDVVRYVHEVIAREAEAKVEARKVRA